MIIRSFFADLDNLNHDLDNQNLNTLDNDNLNHLDNDNLNNLDNQNLNQLNNDNLNNHNNQNLKKLNNDNPNNPKATSFLYLASSALSKLRTFSPLPSFFFVRLGNIAIPRDPAD
ncbi:hypothetical protein KM043_001214 [Ampulex compressa]|nr:hypothetical protein KM043_001214 [Ampulex compressa]